MAIIMMSAVGSGDYDDGFDDNGGAAEDGKDDR